MTYKPQKGVSFYQAIEEVKEIMFDKGVIEAELLFNDISVWVSRDSNENDMATIYDLKRKLFKYEK